MKAFVNHGNTFVARIRIAICVQGRPLRDYWVVSNPLYGNEWISSKVGQDRFEQITQQC